ncbi:MAG: phosphomannomutase, phosphomannomutase [Candidatus Gottesmanbacteria bacterium GW2011_GWA2_43_14]|uniref:Phosphomannomutase, phosphomannomutase n=1 Tax=Candidatus Gottesmanbacteria bacterium GW2011_GWA2_43_14 TaxID=1618443 RepID=A0A0G1DKY0_9BACT|nr:MAG: phosphomannomutase, phosphomannomutase [Candidatus Gottesmanbacteria bacterium GW2011_GWA2_43_14]
MTDISIDTSIFRDYDIRGIYPEQVNEQTFLVIGKSLSSFLKVDKISVGFDARLSSEKLSQSLISGITSMGTDVVTLGQISTEMNYFASGRYGFPASVIVSASHNPPQYNGLKIVKKGVVPLHGSFGLPEIKELAIIQKFNNATRTGKVISMDISDDWLDHLLSFIDPKKLAGMTVVVDTGNGMGGPTWEKINRRLPSIKIIPLFFKPDGHFPNHLPDPLNPDNLVALQEKIRVTKADAGIALDGDADRLFTVDDKGDLLSGTLTCAMLAEHLLLTRGSGPVLYSITTGKIVPETVKKHKGIPFKTRVGHSFIKTEMKKRHALFAGEHSGHFYFRDNYNADSASIAALLFLEFLAVKGKKLSELRKTYESHISSSEINFLVDDTEKFLNNIRKHFAGKELDLIDGLTLDEGSWWFNVRASKTEPLIRLNMEADNPLLYKQKYKAINTVIRQLGGTPKIET